MKWQPTKVREVIRVLSTSTEPVEVLTDAGRAYLKHPMNREGAHALACEWLGTRLAEEFGLRTFETTKIAYDAAAKIELSNGTANPAECFITKYVDGYPWNGSASHLQCLDYRDGLTSLVVLDTWLRNTDRRFVQGGQVHRNNSNVFFARVPGKKWCSLIAMDFSQLLVPLWPRFDLAMSDSLAADPQVFGLFQEFLPFLRRSPLLAAFDKMRGISGKDLLEIMEEIPDEWGIDEESRTATASFLVKRAAYVVESLLAKLETDAPQLQDSASKGDANGE
jgi:hypothetical protein